MVALSNLISSLLLQKKEYEVALVGALQRENDKDTALQSLAEENQAALRLVTI